MLMLLNFLKGLMARSGSLLDVPKIPAPSTSILSPVSRITLIRVPAVNDSISGTVHFGNEALRSLERLGVQIPTGSYEVQITFSHRFGRLLPELMNVPGRTSIRMHPGNSPLDSDGCILIGTRSTPDNLGLLESRVASDHLNEWTQSHLPVKIEIK